MEPKGNDMTVRVCPMRDAICPHGMDCPHVDDGYLCKEGWDTPIGPKGNDMADELREAVAAYEHVWDTWPETIDAGNVKAVRDASIAVVLARLSRPSTAEAIARTADGPEPVAWRERCAAIAVSFVTQQKVIDEIEHYVNSEHGGDATIDHFVPVIARYFAEAIRTHPVPDGPAPAVSEAEVEAAMSAARSTHVGSDHSPAELVDATRMRAALEAAKKVRP